MTSIIELERDLAVERTKTNLSTARSRGLVAGRYSTHKDKVVINFHKSNMQSLKIDYTPMVDFSKFKRYMSTGTENTLKNNHFPIFLLFP